MLEKKKEECSQCVRMRVRGRWRGLQGNSGERSEGDIPKGR